MYRSRKNRMIGGVAGGFAEYFDIDPVIIRALFILLFFAWGASLAAYIVMWIIIPDERKVWERNNATPWTDERDAGTREVDEKRKGRRKHTLALVLIIAGSLLLVHRFVFWLDAEILFPVILIVVGCYILYKTAFKPYKPEAR